MVDTPDDREPGPTAQPELPFSGALSLAEQQRQAALAPRFALAPEADPALHVIHLAATAASLLLPQGLLPTGPAGAAAEAAKAPETRDAFLLRMAPVVEALIFAGDHPLTLKELVAALVEAGEDAADNDGILVVLQRLALKYSGPQSGVVLQEVAGGYALRTSAETGKYLRRGEREKPFRMGRAALETLAIISYRQPVTKAQIDDLRGVDSSGAMKALLDKNLVRVLGKAEEVGRPLLYGTTKTFLEAFNLRVLSDLPTLREYQELSSENQAKVDALGTQQALGRIRDLAQPGARMVTEEAEKESGAAMEELERAMGDATSSTRTAEVVLKAGGKLPPGVDLARVNPGAAPASAEDAAGESAEEMAEDPPRSSAGDDEEKAGDDAE